MIMSTITADNLASGFIGSVLGAFVTYFIYYVSCWRTAKNNLIIKLIGMKNFRFATIEGIDPAIDQVRLYKDSFSEVYGLFLIYRGTFPCFRCNTERIWKKYAGTDGLAILKETHKGLNTNEEAGKRIDILLKEIGYK